MLKLLNFLKHCTSCVVLLFLLSMSIISETAVLSISFIVLFIASLVVVYIFNEPSFKTNA